MGPPHPQDTNEQQLRRKRDQGLEQGRNLAVPEEWQGMRRGLCRQAWGRGRAGAEEGRVLSDCQRYLGLSLKAGGLSKDGMVPSSVHWGLSGL